MRLSVVCRAHLRKERLLYVLTQAKTRHDRKAIDEFVRRFWGELEQLTFDRKLIISEMPAFLASIRNATVGFASFIEHGDALLIAALGVAPQFQSAGVGKRLVHAIEEEGRRRKKKELLVSTSNDDLPALGFYQALGFQIFAVKPDEIARKHGHIVTGLAGLPIRDELRLKKKLVAVSLDEC